MRVNKPRNSRSTAKYFSLFIIAICLFGIAAANIQAATITVTGNGDAVALDGQCTLREAIAAANTNAAVGDCPAGNGDDTIDFSVTGEIVLDASGALPSLSSNITIIGPGANLLSVRRYAAAATNFRILSLSSGAIISISGLTISGGDGSIGGGINNSGTLTLTNSTVSGNETDLWGGGIFNAAGATLNVRYSTVSANKASVNGAGIDNDGTLTIEGSTVSGNTAGLHGGGLYNYSTGTMVLSNTTISGNSASEGGGIFNQQFGTLTVNNSTVTKNTGTAAAGGIRNNEGTLHLNSAIVANSASPVFADVWGPVASGDYNLIENPDGISAPFSGANNITGVDPMLGPLQYNGGPTKTHALLPGSPAIDKGANPQSLATDQRGYSRSYDFAGFPDGSGGFTDIGAFELDPDSDGDRVNDFTDNCPTTPNPERIAFLSTRDGNWEIYVMNADGTNQVNLTNNAADDVDPAFSSDGSKIVFTSLRDGNSEIYVMNADGTNQVDLTNNAANDTEPIFSRDGSRIAFSSTRDGNSEVYVMNADGTNQVNLTNNAASDREPAFSPDGSKITFQSIRDGDWEIYVMNADGTNQVNLTNNAEDDFDPAFSPDGSKIVFTSLHAGNPEIYVVNADGTNQVNLTNNAGLDREPVFSRDGTRIAFSSTRDGNSEVYVMNADGTSQVNLTNNVAPDFQPSWGGQPDSDGDGIGDACEAGTTVTNVTSTSANGTWGVGQIIFIQITFSENVTVTGTPLLTLETGATDAIVTYAGGSGTDTLTFNYTVAAGHASADLDYVSATSLSANGGTIKDATNDATLTLPAPGAAGSLGANKNIVIDTIDTTPPTANNDGYTINEDPASPLTGNVLANDTHGNGKTLTAALTVAAPSGLTFNTDGSFSYTPAANYNGIVQFTYKANDGSLDSNVATVTITVNPVNDSPVASATPNSQSVQYSDPISNVTVTATDIDSTTLTATTTFKVGAGAFGNGLPSGLSLASPVCAPSGSGTGCQWTLSGKANVAAGTYVIRVTVSDGGLSTSSDVTLIVNKEKTETIYTGDVFMFTAGPTVTTANVRLSAQLTQQADGNAGDITKAKVSFLLFKSSNFGATPDLTVSGVPVDATGAALKSVNLGVDTWTIKVKIDADNGYWKASPVGMGTVTVEQPTNELRTSGGGWVADAQSLNGKGNFGFNVANQKKGVRGGSVYLFRGPDGFNYLVKNTSWQSGGIGFNSEGAILSKAAFSGKCVVQKIDSDTGEIVDSFGNYSFTVDVRDGDLFNPRQADKYAITVLNSNGLVWRQIGSRTNPPAIGGGNITVKGK